MWPQRSSRSSRASGAQPKPSVISPPSPFASTSASKSAPNRRRSPTRHRRAGRAKARHKATGPARRCVGAGGLGSIGERRGAVDRLMQGDLDLRRAAPAEQPRRDHAGVVEHEQIARAEQRRQIAHTAILERLPRGPPAGGRHRAAAPDAARSAPAAGRNRTDRRAWRGEFGATTGPCPDALVRPSSRGRRRSRAQPHLRKRTY